MRSKKLFPAMTLAATAGLSTLVLGGCADNRATLFIDSIAPPDFSSEDCSADASATIGSGRWDPGTGIPYTAFVRIGNQMAPLGDNDTLRPETSRIQIQGAEIEILGPDGGVVVPAFTTPYALTIHPEDSESPGWATAALPLIPGDAGPDLTPGTTYTVNFRVFGETLAGTEIESGYFGFPVLVMPAGSFIECVPTGVSEDYLEERFEDVGHSCGWPQENRLVFCFSGGVDTREFCDELCP